MDQLQEARDLVYSLVTDRTKKGPECIYVFTGDAVGEIVTVNPEGKVTWQYQYTPHETNICYVGMGYRHRVEQDLFRKIFPPPCNRIVLYEGLQKAEAHRIEKALIKHFGRIHKGDGCLVNETSGGSGRPDPPIEYKAYHGKRVAETNRVPYEVVDKDGKVLYSAASLNELKTWLKKKGSQAISARPEWPIYVEGLKQRVYIKKTEDPLHYDPNWKRNKLLSYPMGAWSVGGVLVVGSKLSVEKKIGKKLTGNRLVSGDWKCEYIEASDPKWSKVLNKSLEELEDLLDTIFFYPDRDAHTYVNSFCPELYESYCIDEAKQILWGGNGTDLARASKAKDGTVYKRLTEGSNLPIKAGEYWVCRSKDYETFRPCTGKLLLLHASPHEYFIGTIDEFRCRFNDKVTAISKLAKGRETYLNKWRCEFLHEASLKLREQIGV